MKALIQNTLYVSNTGEYSVEEIRSLARTYTLSAVEAMDRRSGIWVHESGGRINGVVCLDGDMLQALFVAPDRQRSGIGRLLVAFASAKARASGSPHLRVPASLTAVDFYRAVGFTSQGPGRTNGNVRVLWMIKSLKP